MHGALRRVPKHDVVSVPHAILFVASGHGSAHAGQYLAQRLASHFPGGSFWISAYGMFSQLSRHTSLLTTLRCVTW
jgi:hypothetical protein